MGFISAAAELFPGVAVLAAEPGVVFGTDASVADVDEPQASPGIAVPSAVLVPASDVAVELDISRRPRYYLFFANAGQRATCATAVEVAGCQSVHSTTGSHTSYDFCSALSIRGLHQNKTLEHCHSEPSLGRNAVSDTNHLAMVATTSHSKKTSLYLYREQHKHRPCQATQQHVEVLKT